MEVILEKAKNQFSQNLPFVIYKKPHNSNVIGLFQRDDTLFEATEFTETGFVFASFDGSQTFLIPENESEIIRLDFQKKEIKVLEKEFNLPNETARNNFENLVTKGIQSITGIIASRFQAKCINAGRRVFLGRHGAHGIDF